MLHKWYNWETPQSQLWRKDLRYSHFRRLSEEGAPIDRDDRQPRSLCPLLLKYLLG
uniref:Uncharacterized protein n=1 Tax=Rhizophora mucronata TaxID=61149 RepID=A0A2P2KI33_RHIMU